MPEETNTETQETTPELSDLEKLKANNAEFEKELIKAREMKTERQKLESDELLAGSAGANIQTKVVSPEEQKQSNASEFFKDTALGDAIDKVNE